MVVAKVGWTAVVKATVRVVAKGETLVKGRALEMALAWG